MHHNLHLHDTIFSELLQLAIYFEPNRFQNFHSQMSKEGTMFVIKGQIPHDKILVSDDRQISFIILCAETVAIAIT